MGIEAVTLLRGGGVIIILVAILLIIIFTTGGEEKKKEVFVDKPVPPGYLGACKINGWTAGDESAWLPTENPDRAGECKQDVYACEGAADIVFVMDGSGSVQPPDYLEATDFLLDLATGFALGDHLIKIGFVQYSGTGESGCDPMAVNPTCPIAVLNPFIIQDLTSDVTKICTAITANQIKSGTPMIQGLQTAVCMLQASSKTARFIVFLTDGAPSATGGTAETISNLANATKAAGIKIFALAVGTTSSILEDMASEPKSTYFYETPDFDSLLSGNFSSAFVDQVECNPQPKNEERCECWFKPDLLACPIVQLAQDYECGGGTGTFNYECTAEEKADEDSQYLLWNILLWLYKLFFILSLRFVLGCRTIDLGHTSVGCFDFVGYAYIFLFIANVASLFLTYVSRCFPPIYYIFLFIFLHLDALACVANRVMMQERKAPPPVEAPRSNLELFAYTNNKKGWKEKAFQTIELGRAKTTIKQTSGKQKAADAYAKQRAESMKKKGFSMKGAGMI